MKTKTRAFTLIELLVVIGVIAILAAIAFPVINRAREGGRRANCLSNLHQLGMAVALYTADYDSLFPYALDSLKYHSGRLDAYFEEPYLTLAKNMPDLRGVLAPYIHSNNELYRCLSEHPFGYNTDHYVSIYQETGSSYSYNSSLALLGQNDSSIQEVSYYYLMADYEFWHGGDSAQDGRLNELFADYHVKNVSWLYYLDSIEDSERL
jgi:general secretion pathway protein G